MSIVKIGLQCYNAITVDLVLLNILIMLGHVVILDSYPAAESRWEPLLPRKCYDLDGQHLIIEVITPILLCKCESQLNKPRCLVRLKDLEQGFIFVFSTGGENFKFVGACGGLSSPS